MYEFKGHGKLLSLGRGTGERGEGTPKRSAPGPYFNANRRFSQERNEIFDGAKNLKKISCKVKFRDLTNFRNSDTILENKEKLVVKRLILKV